MQQNNIDQPKWHEAMSEMLPDGDSAPAPTPAKPGPMPSPWVDRWVEIEQSAIVKRWVEIVQIAPPVVRIAEPMVTPRAVLMVILFVTGTLAIVMIFQGRSSRRNRRY